MSETAKFARFILIVLGISALAAGAVAHGYRAGFEDALHQTCVSVGGAPVETHCIHPQALRLPPLPLI